VDAPDTPEHLRSEATARLLELAPAVGSTAHKPPV